MLSQLDHLSVAADGRYATDAELMFFQSYLRTARLRFGLYQKLQQLESKIVQEVLAQLKSRNPTALQVGDQDLTAKWQRDTVRTLRYAAMASLIDDPDLYRERMLLWFQTVMRSFGAGHSCNVTYQAMQVIVRKYLSVEEAAIICPLLEMSRAVLGEP
ncbi:MAG: phycobilisome protein [Cyanobacteria bacterium]|nr:phycobilisome protein [Cyanobacteriota bacterium]MDA0866688.1 phycobilisome protein [Cyanobacteriota bacterium]